MSRRIGLPDHVVREALKRGAHQYCIDSGPEYSCKNCASVVEGVFRDLYGTHRTKLGVFLAIVRDLLREK